VTSTVPDPTDELAHDRKVAEELQDRLRREQQTAAALRAFLLARAGNDTGEQSAR
jgi:hypothetical protein